MVSRVGLSQVFARAPRSLLEWREREVAGVKLLSAPDQRANEPASFEAARRPRSSAAMARPGSLERVWTAEVFRGGRIIPIFWPARARSHRVYGSWCHLARCCGMITRTEAWTRRGRSRFSVARSSARPPTPHPLVRIGHRARFGARFRARCALSAGALPSAAPRRPRGSPSTSALPCAWARAAAPDRADGPRERSSIWGCGMLPRRGASSPHDRVTPSSALFGHGRIRGLPFSRGAPRDGSRIQAWSRSLSLPRGVDLPGSSREWLRDWAARPDFFLRLSGLVPIA